VSPDAADTELEGELGRRFGVAGVAVLAVLTLVLGLGAGYVLGRPAHPGDASVDAGFARDMSTHHGQGVDMAMTMYRATNDPDLRQVAVDIGLTQQAQIGMMQAWLGSWGLSPTGSQPPMSWMSGHSHGADAPPAMRMGPDGLMPGMATPAQLEQLRQATGKAKEVLFCQLMIRHHKAGVAMAAYAAQHATEAQVRQLAQQIVDGQTYEISVLTGFLTERGATPLPS
jgi:uncharacterized protein (DUF305 family)